MAQTLKRRYPMGTKFFRGCSPVVLDLVYYKKIVTLVDQWLLSSGASPLQTILSACKADCTAGGTHAPAKGWGQSVAFGAENARFETAAALMLLLAVSLMRTVSYTLAHPDVLRSSGMLLRCVHLLRYILAALPATPPV